MELGQQLANLGSVVAGGLERRAQETRFQNALPIMQQTFQSAMADFDAGKSGSGFSKIMSVAMENPTNPFIQNMSMMAMKAGEMASNDYISKMRASGTGVGISPEDLEAFEGFGGEGGGTGDQIDAEAADGLPNLEEPVAEVQSFEVDEAYTPAEGEQLIETPWFNEMGINVAAVVGPKEYSVKEIGKLTTSMSIGNSGVSSTKSQTEEIIQKNKQEAAEFKSLVDESRSAAQSFKSNAQLKRIFNDSGRDFTNIEIDEDVDEYTGKTSYKALVTKADGSVSEEQLTEAEAGKLKVFKEKIPEFSERAGIRIIKPKPQATEAAAEETPMERFPIRDAAEATAVKPTQTAPAKELSLAEQIAGTRSVPESAPVGPRKQPERRGARGAQVSSKLNKERTELRKALYEVTNRGEMRGLKKGLDANNPVVKKGIERLKEIEKELASL